MERRRKLLSDKMRDEAKRQRELEREGEAQKAQETKEAEAGRPIPRKRLPFEQRYQRVTTYLENGLFGRIEELRGRGEIVSITALYNGALGEYLEKYYGEIKS